MRKYFDQSWILLILIIFLIIFSRAPEVLLLPSLQVEDGTEIFAYYYQNRSLSEILRFRGGFIHLLNNLIGFVSVRFPVRWIPYVLTWIPLSITLVAYSLFFSKKYRIYIKSDFIRFIICVLITLHPCGQFHYVAHTDYSFENDLLILILISIISFENLNPLLFVIINVLIWSHPLSIVTLPFFLFAFIKHKDIKSKLSYAFILINLFIYNRYGVMASHVYNYNFLEHIKFFLLTIHYIVNFVVFGTSVGYKYFFILNNLKIVSTIYTIAFFIILILNFRKIKTIGIISLYLLFTLSYLTILGRGENVVELGFGASRYFYIQSIFFIILVVSIYSIFIESLTRRTSLIRDTLLKTASIPIVFISLFLNIGNSWRYHYSHPDNGYRVKIFFAELDRLQRQKGSYRGIKLRVDKIDDWPIVINTTNL
jgi:hypothetical protein